jgi:adenylate cyclase
MSGDAEQEYFSDGISEDITTDLSKVSALGVTARNTAFMFKGQGADVCEIAQKLCVSHVLEGSVRKAGGRVRITAQLVEGTSGDHVWAERYDRELTDIFAIQDEISKAIVDALKIKLLPEEKKAIEQRGTNSAEAYNLYLMARRYWITGNWGDTRQLELVIRICQRAVEIDPNYARAWGLMAIVQSILHFTFNLGDNDGTAAAEKALALDPTIAEAYCVRARHQYEKGEFGKADELLARAVELDRNSWEVNRETARIFFFQRRFEEAVRHWERAVAVDDTDYHSWGMMCSAYEALGDQEKLRHAAEMALMHSERVLANDPTNGAAHGIGAFGLAMRGERDRLKDWIARALLVSPDNIIMRYNFACTTALYMDDPDAALDLLEPVLVEVTESAYKAISSDPDMDSLRGDPRFKRMMEGAAKRLRIASPTPAAAT